MTPKETSKLILNLSKKGGERINSRINLRQLAIDGPRVLGNFRGYPGIKRISNRPEFSNIDWQDLDLTSSDLGNAAFSDGRIVNCVFDQANCQKIGFWNVQVTDCSFKSTDLRGSVLGSYEKRDTQPNKFEGVCFDNADLRETVHYGDQYRLCTFRNAQLQSLKFVRSWFEDCTFEGVLDDVIFWAKAPGYDLPETRLSGCDFSRCRLKFVDFRNIDLANVKLPIDRYHIFMPNGPDDLRVWKNLARGFSSGIVSEVCGYANYEGRTPLDHWSWRPGIAFLPGADREAARVLHGLRDQPELRWLAPGPWSPTKDQGVRQRRPCQISTVKNQEKKSSVILLTGKGYSHGCIECRRSDGRKVLQH